MSDFIVRRKQEWAELDILVRKAGRWAGMRRMTPEELHRLDELYRRAAIDYAQVCSRTRDPQLQQYLNRLVAAAHSVIYVPQRTPIGKRAAMFVIDGFARCVARNWKYHLLSFVLLLSGVLAGYESSRRDPAASYALMPEQEFRRLGAGKEQLEEWLRGGRDETSEKKVFFASFLFSNNLRVGMMSLAAGVLAAIPSVLLIVYNGMILGVFTAVHHANGIYGEYWAWILPHGVTELGGIILCGGMGLCLGRAVVCPGKYSRIQSLTQAGREAFRTVMGVAVMLFGAAFIESFIRQSHLTTHERFWFAGATALLWGGYFLWGFYRERRAQRLGLYIE